MDAVALLVPLEKDQNLVWISYLTHNSQLKAEEEKRSIKSHQTDTSSCLALKGLKNPKRQIVQISDNRWHAQLSRLSHGDHATFPRTLHLVQDQAATEKSSAILATTCSHACSFRKIQIVKNFWSPWKMAISEPKSAHLREALLFTFNWKKSATEAHRMLEKVYSDHALSKSQCYRWFKKFQSGDLELDNEPHGKPPQKFEDAELQALLDEDSTQMQEKLAKQLQVSQGAVSLRLNSLGMTQKLSRWVPHELSERQQ
ncbi:hypothetical protein LAZ67_17002753 [Cordylochernes scorpioides]|uniref:Mos1 transposase HTH domain-containing protein n=1 Tax=Cordylochernes scorpioides TaxID=51811 RepID=A0ABY6LGU0_9ARAC|nr:hypothetical protein LAZ67_17002753 [Cordylochernes scorpioides]